jgi:myo-inositol-1(or 4)-monophosphatase
MITTESATVDQPRESSFTNPELLTGVVATVQAAGARLLERYGTTPTAVTRDDVVTAIHANDDASLAILRPALQALRPQASWAEDELDGGPLPAGEWWVSDPVEGNVNHVHAMADWGVTATLVRDNTPVLTVVHLPLSNDTYTAVHGGGAILNGTPIRTSSKTELGAALVGTGQAAPGEPADTHRKMGYSVTKMLGAALVVRVSVPATLQLIAVAAGRMDVFWQFSAVRSGLLAGALLVTEAGGLITDLHGQPWGLHSDSFLAAAPGVHAQAATQLSDIS